MSELRELARFLSGLRWEDVPEEVRKTVRLLLLDNLGAALGAAKIGRASCRERVFITV